MSTRFKRAQVSKAWREHNRRNGLCVGCTRKGFALCKVCRSARAAFQRERIAKGLCFRCRNVAASERTKCLDCVLKVALYQLKRKGLSQSELNKATKAFQKYVNLCASCGLEIPIGKERFDHDDKKKKFRGIICHGCNVAIGFAEENIQRLHGCIRYLEKQR
jgi:hypothetical protein